MLTSIQAQNDQRNIIKTNPLTLAFGNLNFTYERVLNNDQSSVLIYANYLYQLFGVDINTGGIGLGYRYYLTHEKKDVPTGLYVNPKVAYSGGNLDESKFSLTTMGAEVGYQWAWDSGVTLDLGVGPSYAILGNKDDIDFDNGSGVIPSGTLALGFAF